MFMSSLLLENILLILSINLNFSNLLRDGDINDRLAKLVLNMLHEDTDKRDWCGLKPQ